MAADDRIPWEAGAPVDNPDEPYLVVAAAPTVTMALRQSDEQWTCSWAVGIRPERTLPEVEAFMRRVARMIDEEPVR